MMQAVRRLTAAAEQELFKRKTAPHVKGAILTNACRMQAFFHPLIRCSAVFVRRVTGVWPYAFASPNSGML